MKILIVNSSEPLPFDEPAPRSQRTGMLVNELIERGHEVVWISSGFNHHSKTFRAVEKSSFEYKKGLTFILLKCPRYLKNVSVGRFINHMVMGLRLRNYLRTKPYFDVIYCSFPPIELAYVVSSFGRLTRTPVLLDGRDRWPELIVEQCPRVLHVIARAILRPYYAMAKSAFRNASAITGTSEGMVDFGLKLAGRNRSKADEHNYMSFEKPAISEDEEHLLIEKYQAELVEDKNTLTICFFGTFVSQRAVDFETCIDGIKNLPRQLHVRLIMCGDGPRYKAMLARCETVDTIFLPGRVSAKEMWMISSIADIGLLPYQPISHFEFSIPNKVPEYLSSGLPILTSLTRGTVHDILRKKGLGIFYESGNLTSFRNAIDQCVQLKRDGGLPLKQQSAKMLYKEIFDAKKINLKFAVALEQLAKEREISE